MWIFVLFTTSTHSFTHSLICPVAESNCSAYVQATKPCQNGGLCYQHNGVVRCNCPAGFTGVNCQIRKSNWDRFLRKGSSRSRQSRMFWFVLGHPAPQIILFDSLLIISSICFLFSCNSPLHMQFHFTTDLSGQ